MVSNGEFRPAANDPSGSLVVEACAFMGCGKGISKERGVLHVGHGHTRGPIEHGMAKNEAHARARSHQPTGFRRLGNSESRWRAAWIGGRGGFSTAQVHLTEVPLQAKNKVVPLEV